MHLQFRPLVAALLVSVIAVSAGAADVTQRSILAAWKGRTVILRQRLYTLVYNERGRLGKTYANRREGLMVLTPSEGNFLKFDGRQHREDVIMRDPNLMTAAVAREYQEIRSPMRTYCGSSLSCSFSTTRRRFRRHAGGHRTRHGEADADPGGKGRTSQATPSLDHRAVAGTLLEVVPRAGTSRADASRFPGGRSDAVNSGRSSRSVAQSLSDSVAQSNSVAQSLSQTERPSYSTATE